MAKRSKKKKKNKKKKNKFFFERKQKKQGAEPIVKQPSLDEVMNADEEELDEIQEMVESKKTKKGKQKEKTKPRKGLGEELIEVYEAAGDDLTSVTTLEHRRRSWQRMLMVVLGFLVAVFLGVAAVSWFIWGGQQTFNGEQVQFEISALDEAHSGDIVEYTISYANNGDAGFRKSEVELRYPSGFIYESAEPEPTNGENLWDLGSLSSLASGEIMVKGKLVGIPEEDTTLSGVFRYWPANFSSEFQEVSAVQTYILPIDLGFRVDGPDQVLVGQTTSYSVVLVNETDEEVKDVRVEAIYPQEFVVEESIPSRAKEEDNFWDIDSIAAGEELEIQIDGFFSTASEDSTQFIFNLQQKGADEDDFFQQKEERLDTNLVEGDLAVNLIANGATKDSSVQWGEAINGSISYQNSSEADLANLTATVTIQTRYRFEKAEKGSKGALNFATLVDSNKGSVKEVDAIDGQSVHVKTITWDKSDVDSLDELGPDEEGTINFQVSLYDLKQAMKELDHPEDAEIDMVVEMTIGQTGGVKEEIKVTSNLIKFVINTDLALDAHARYYDEQGNEIGSGPLPPRINQKTTYRIIWELENSIHEAKNIIVSTQLPSNVAWTNQYQVDAGEVEFSASSNDLSWRLNKFPLNEDSIKLSFDVVLTPTDTQIGEIANLTKKITMTAVDATTEGKIIQAISSIDTGIERDEKGNDKGIVLD